MMNVAKKELLLYKFGPLIAGDDKIHPHLYKRSAFSYLGSETFSKQI